MSNGSDDTIQTAIRRHISRISAKYRWNLSKTADALGVHRRQMQRLLFMHNLHRFAVELRGTTFDPLVETKTR